MRKTNLRNFILLFFILLSTFNYSVYGEKLGQPLIRDNHASIPSNTDEITTIRLVDENKPKLSKKDLKDEIKRRKKHHKALLSIYNESFEEKYLELIADNSSKLTKLRELLQS